MSQESRDAAKQVKEELNAAQYHLNRAKEKVQLVPDKDLQRKVTDVHQKKSGCPNACRSGSRRQVSHVDG